MAPSRVDVIDIGNMPYPTVRTILLQINSAKQLRQLEVNSPQLEGDDAECWARLIGRDFPVLAKRFNFAPKNPASWHKIYARYERLEADQKREAEVRLKAAFAGIKKEKEENVSHIVDFDRRKLPHPPRDGRGLAGAARKPGGGGRRGGGTDESDLRFTGGTRTKTTTASSVLKKARREAREISARNRLATPTGLLPVRQGQIASAPKAMVEEARIKSQPATRNGGVGVGSGGDGGGGTLRAPRSTGGGERRELEEREARLRRLKNARNIKDATVVSDSDLESEDDDEGGGYDGNGGEDVYGDEDDFNDNDDDVSGGPSGGGGLDPDDLEDLFDEKPKPSPARPIAKPVAPSTLLSRSSTGTVKRSGILSNAPGSSRAMAMAMAKPVPRPIPTPIPTQPKKAYSPPLEHSSPPPKQHYSPPASAAASSASSPELKPQQMVARKRKPVDIFMKPKPKVQKR